MPGNPLTQHVSMAWAMRWQCWDAVGVLDGTRWGGVILKVYTDLGRFAPQHVSYLGTLAITATNDSLYVSLMR